MKYTSKDIQQILTSKTAIDGLDYITPIYHEAKTALWIMEAMGIQGDLFVKWVKETIEQILPQTATWALDYWEEEYGLPVHPNLSIEQRRQKIINAVRTRAPMNPRKLEELLERAFQIEKVKVVERTHKNTFAVEIYKQLLEEQWQEIFDMIEKYKPAHLILEAKSILETPMPEKQLFIAGAVFNPIDETILPEMPFSIHTNLNIAIDYCNIEVTRVIYPALAFMTAEEVKNFLTINLLPEFLLDMEGLIKKHNEDKNAHPELKTLLDADLTARIERLENALYYDIKENPFLVTFETLNGIVLTKGVWNKDKKRLEC